MRPVASGRPTEIRTGTGAVTINLTEAEFYDWAIEIVFHVHVGQITVIVPRGFDVRQVGAGSPVSSTFEQPIPGFPVVRLSASMTWARPAWSIRRRKAASLGVISASPQVNTATMNRPAVKSKAHSDVTPRRYS